MAREQVVRVEELSRHFGDKVAVDRVSFAIARSVVLKSSETFQIVSRFAFFIFLFTSSVFFPQSSAPLAIQGASLANPLTYTTDIFLAGLFSAVTSTVSLGLGVLAIEAAAMFVIAVVAFRRFRVRATGSHFRSPPRPMS